MLGLSYTSGCGAGAIRYAITPNATKTEGDSCYPNLGSIPGGVEAVVVATKPEVVDDVMRDCISLGIKYVWKHRGIGRAASRRRQSRWGARKVSLLSLAGAP